MQKTSVSDLGHCVHTAHAVTKKRFGSLFDSPLPVLTTEAHGGELVVGAVGVDHHHAGAVVPLQLQTSWAADQVHVARVVDLESKLLESRLGVP